MISDLKQPTHLWLADVIDNFSSQLKNGDAPMLEIEAFGAKVEVRLMSLGSTVYHEKDTPSDTNP